MDVNRYNLYSTLRIRQVVSIQSNAFFNINGRLPGGFSISFNWLIFALYQSEMGFVVNFVDAT
jgi:hypothetical protein